MNPSEIGERAEGAVLSTLLKAGYPVLLPFGGSRRYDLVFEKDGIFHRVQVKHGRVMNDAVMFNTMSTRGRGEHRVARCYVGEVDFFGVYCSELDTVYLVPIGDTAQAGGDCRLRLLPTKNNLSKRIKWAKDYQW